MFQSTLPRRERLLIARSSLMSRMFQSTLPRRERRQYRFRITSRSTFQSTLPRRERHSTQSRKLPAYVCFNPRSREGSDMFYQAITDHFLVSIHAPAKGATPSMEYSRLMLMFQSTLPRRERRTQRRRSSGLRTVSIHAPAKGATAISAKNSFYFSAEINKLSFYILNFPLFPSPLFSTFHFICAHFRVRIPRHFYVCFLFALLYYHKINVSSTAIPRSTPICSTFV